MEGGGSAVTFKDYLDTMPLAGVVASCVLEPDFEFVGRMPIDAAE